MLTVIRATFIAALGLISSYASAQFSFPFAPAPNHLRIMTWNIEFFNTRVPPRTSTQLNALGQRIIESQAAVVALEEMNDTTALQDLRNRMGSPWAVYLTSGQQNAFLYDTSKVTISDSSFVYSHGTTYPESLYRAPVTAIFSPVAAPSFKFRLIGIHGHWNDPNLRDVEGFWLSDYVDDLLANPSEPRSIILLGDYNGEVPAAPHNGIVSGGKLENIPKRNGDITTIYTNKIDYIYATYEARQQLSEPTTFVVRPEYYGETGTDFRDTYSDHLPVFIDYAITDLDTDDDLIQNDAETNTGTFVDAGDTGTDPNDSDTDDDGVIDGVEVSLGTDPNDAFDFPVLRLDVPVIALFALGALGALYLRGPSRFAVRGRSRV